MKAKTLIELLQRVDGDVEIEVCVEGGFTKNITLWDWIAIDGHRSILLSGIDKQDWTDMNLPYTEGSNDENGTI